ncbi:hypothetical protein QUC22_05495 [Dehalococcoides mccartyi]|uniref:hypothetical protein n=1 Tax=Dehalococcoides TaxID=61434 RepID=UPI003219603B
MLVDICKELAETNVAVVIPVALCGIEPEDRYYGAERLIRLTVALILRDSSVVI